MNDKDKEAFKLWGADEDGDVPLLEGPAYEAWQSACEHKQKEIDEMKKVIEYYANPENWDFEEIEKSDVEFCEDPQAELGGKRARKYLFDKD